MCFPEEKKKTVIVLVLANDIVSIDCIFPYRRNSRRSGSGV